MLFGKLSIFAFTILLLNCLLSYACIGLNGRNFRDCHLGDFCAEAHISTDENAAFLECCRERGLPKICLQKCSYINYNQNAIRKMFLQIDPCPLILASDIHFCAAQGHDHRQCCAANGVTATIAGQKCLIFCDQRMQISTILDETYLPCFEQFENIKGCFWRWARKRYDQEAELSDEFEINQSRTISNYTIQLTTKKPPSPFDNDQ